MSQQRRFIGIGILAIRVFSYTVARISRLKGIHSFTAEGVLVGCEVVRTMPFDLLIGFVVRAGEWHQKMTAHPDGDQSIAAPEVVFDAAPDPLLAFAGAFAGDNICLTAELLDVVKDRFALESRQLGLFVVFSHEVQLLVEGPGDM